MARRSLKPQLNQIRTWVRQGRTDAWIAHQLEVSVKDIAAFKVEHELVPGEAVGGASDLFGPRAGEEEPDLRGQDEALVAAALEAERESRAAEEDEDAHGGPESGDGDAEAGEEKPRRRRRGRRGGRDRAGAGRRSTAGARKALEGTFDHGAEGYGLWLDPAVQDDPVYAEHWAGHRPVAVTVEADRIVITRAGQDSSAEDDADGED